LLPIPLAGFRRATVTGRPERSSRERKSSGKKRERGTENRKERMEIR